MELHPLCSLFPRMSGPDFEALCEDIRANGLREPIVTHQGMILDGGNRHQACLTAGVDPQFVEFDGADPVTFVLSVNLHRRHLTPGQHAAIVASVTDWREAQTHGGSRRSDQGATLHLETVADRAAVSGASRRTQKMADQVAKSDPELARAVGRGETTLTKAAKKVAAKKPKKPPKAKKVVALVAVEHEHGSEVDDLKEAVTILTTENERLNERLAVEAMNASEEERTAASNLIAELRTTISVLKAENAAIKVSRDTLLTENAQLKQQCAFWRRKVEKAERAA